MNEIAARGPLAWRRARVETRTDGVLRGVARVDVRTKRLVGRLRPGEIAVIDHQDLDLLAAETLVERHPAAVLNAAASSTGRYANAGPLVILRAGIVLVDGLGPAVMERISEGSMIEVEGAEVRIDGETVAVGHRQDTESIGERHLDARRQETEELGRFVENTVAYLEQNHDLLTGAVEVPDPGVDLTDRHVLIVVRGAGYREDLALLRQSGYLREMRPVLIGVDGGADALLEAGYTPDIILGDFDSVSADALGCGAALMVHAYPDGRAPGAQRLDAEGYEYSVFRASGTSEDIAMLLAYERGAELIVAVGTHSSMVEFLDKGRDGMASTLLVRMRVGPILVDAKGVNRLYSTRVRKRDLVILVLAAVAAMVAVVWISEPLRLLIRANWVLLTGLLPGVL